MELGFRIWFEEKTVYIPMTSLTAERCGDVTTYRTEVGEAAVAWTHTACAGGSLVQLEVTSQKPLGIRRMDSIVCSVGIPEATDHITTMGRSVLTNEIRFPHEFGVDTEYCPNAVGLFRHLDYKQIIISSSFFLPSPMFCHFNVLTCFDKKEKSISHALSLLLIQ